MTPPPNAWIGIDVAKDTLAACLLRQEGKPLLKEFANSPAGFAKLLRWTQSLAPEALCHFCLEATGAYSQAVAIFLSETEQKVSVINPFRIHHAALAQGARNQTDPLAAQVIATFARQQNPPLWRLAAPEVRLLVALLRRLQALKDHRTQESNRLGEPGVPKPVRHSLKQSLHFLDAQITQLEQQIHTHISGHPQLKADRELLVSIPGIAELTAAWLLAELPAVSEFADAKQAAAYAGLNPREQRSGTSVRKRTRLSKQGNGHLRRALYMPALAAMRYNPLVRALCERLLAAGRPRMVAVGAAMRKLLMLCYGVLKSRTKFTTEPPKKVPAAT